jgi:hypothetical protein
MKTRVVTVTLFVVCLSSATPTKASERPGVPGFEY